MAIFPKITCQKCRRAYSAHMNKCPHCGAKREAVSSRAATTSDRAKNARKSKDAVTNAQWQFAFGLILVSVVMLSVIVLISSNLGDAELPTEEVLPSAPVEVIVPEATPTPTPTPAPTTNVTSISIYYLTNPIEGGFTAYVGDEVQLNASVYPIDVSSTVEWSSSDDAVFTVDSTGKVVGVGEGSATLTASCGGIQAQCQVIIR